MERAGCPLPKNPIPRSRRASPLLPHSKISSDAVAPDLGSHGERERERESDSPRRVMPASTQRRYLQYLHCVRLRGVITQLPRYLQLKLSRLSLGQRRKNSYATTVITHRPYSRTSLDSTNQQLTGCQSS